MVKRSTLLHETCPSTHALLVFVGGGRVSTLESEEGKLMGNGWF